MRNQNKNDRVENFGTPTRTPLLCRTVASLNKMWRLTPAQAMETQRRRRLLSNNHIMVHDSRNVLHRLLIQRRDFRES